MLTLPQLKTHLRLDLTDTSEDQLLLGYQLAAVGAFKKLSKRRWPVASEPTDPKSGAFLDEAVLDADEQAIANQWQLLAIAHWYENRQPVVVDTRAVAVEVPQTCDMLMSLVRTPTL